jgi:chemotaxis protein histidine kinase CheA
MLPLAAAGALGPLTGQTKPPLTGSAKIAFDALNPPLRSDPGTRIPRRTTPSLRPFLGKGGLISLGLGAGLWSGGLSKEQGIVPESGALTPEQLFKLRNDAEEARLRSVEEPGLWDRTKGLFGGLLRQDPNIPEEPIWDPQASISQEKGLFSRILSPLISKAAASQAPLSSMQEAMDIPDISIEDQIKAIIEQNKRGQARFLPGGSSYPSTGFAPKEDIYTPKVTFTTPTGFSTRGMGGFTGGAQRYDMAADPTWGTAMAPPLYSQSYIDSLDEGPAWNLQEDVRSPEHWQMNYPEIGQGWYEGLPDIPITSRLSSLDESALSEQNRVMEVRDKANRKALLDLSEDRAEEIKKKPTETRTSVEEQEIVASEVTRALFNASEGKPVKEELQAIVDLAQIDPTIADRYTTPGSQDLIDITSQVESFAGIPETTTVAHPNWYPPTPSVPDIVVPPPAQATAPYVEEFKAFTPPKPKGKSQAQKRAESRARAADKRAAKKAANKQKAANKRAADKAAAARDRATARAAKASRAAEKKREADTKKAAEKQRREDKSAQKIFAQHKKWAAENAKMLRDREANRLKQMGYNKPVTGSQFIYT